MMYCISRLPKRVADELMRYPNAWVAAVVGCTAPNVRYHRQTYGYPAPGRQFFQQFESTRELQGRRSAWVAEWKARLQAYRASAGLPRSLLALPQETLAEIWLRPDGWIAEVLGCNADSVAYHRQRLNIPSVQHCQFRRQPVEQYRSEKAAWVTRMRATLGIEPDPPAVAVSTSSSRRSPVAPKAATPRPRPRPPQLADYLAQVPG